MHKHNLQNLNVFQFSLSSLIPSVLPSTLPKGGVTLLFHFSHLLHYNVDVQWDRIRGINIYSPDPADLGSRLWHRVPTSATQTVAMWELPLPTDMASSSDPLVSRSVFVRSLMERSRGDIRQWSWVWEREIEKVMFVSSKTMEESFSRKVEIN